MKDLKKKYGEESREDKKNRHKKLFLPSLLSLTVCIAMVIVGYQYKDDCDVNAAMFLLLGGGIVLATSTMNVVAYLTPCDWDDRLADILTPLAYFAHFVVMIWGTITIFGVYSEVVYEKNQSSQYYCNPVPFKFAFGFLIYSWICLPFVLCCQMLICCSVILYAILPSSPESQETTELRE